MRRREFLQVVTGAMAGAALPRITSGGDGANPRPNILWISTEDISPDLGCYGDKYAVTPNLDRLAAEGVRCTRVFSHAPVCAPARSGIITGMYPTTIGTHQMRCKAVPPPYVKCFTEYLRAAGYYCTNKSKTDYQFDAPVTAWDVCGGDQAHWRTRPEGRPFFSVINLTTTHESQIRSRQEGLLRRIAELGPNERHDPAKAALPPYYPDMPLVRHDWAQYYDIVTLMDKEVADILKQLEDDGLADDTIVWFWGDHGRGMPRAKRWIYDSGIHVPLLVRVPDKWRKLAMPDSPDAVKPGSVNDDLIGFIDFAPTMLSLCGVKIPEHIQGRAFLGPQKAAPREYIYAARDRMDETYDLIRAVRDKRYKYIRNYMSHLTYGQDIDYMNQMPTMQEMRRLHAEGKLVGPQQLCFRGTKPIEELYDTANDPHEVHDLSSDPKYRDVLERMRKEHLAWAKRTGDVGLIPEPELDEMMRPGGEYEVTSAPGVMTLFGSGASFIEITCATPGASIAYRLSGTKDAPASTGFFLPVDDAKMHGKGATRRGGQVSAWRDRDTWFSWETDIPTAGRMPVHVWQAYARKGPGSEYILTVGDVQLRGVVQRTSGWDDYQFIKIGEVDIPKPGRYAVSIRPAKATTPYSMNLRSVVLNGKNLQNAGPPGNWQLYAASVSLWPQMILTAKACRLGFRDSKVVAFCLEGDTAVPPQPNRSAPDWRARLDGTDLLDRLRALKALDGEGAKAKDACVKALSDPDAAVRYWAVIGLHTLGMERDAVGKLLGDPSPIVRIAAAQAMCDWGHEKEALPVLVAALSDRSPSVRHNAAIALGRVGEKARPALAEIEASLKDKYGYVSRVSQYTRRRLEEPADR